MTLGLVEIVNVNVNQVKISRNLCMHAHLFLDAGVFKLRSWTRVSIVWSNISGSIDEAGRAAGQQLGLIYGRADPLID